FTSGVNVAPGKPASQIPGTHGDIKASSAVNEDITELQHSVPCANLNFKRHGQYFFFWDAKLRGSYFISGIRIYHKDNGVACRHPFVPNGNTNATDKSFTGTNILLQCVSGYIASTSTSVCTSRGTWHPKLVCANGNTKRICADHQVLTRFNSSVCENGYELRDSAERTCLENGSWSGTTPNCEKIRCTNQTILKDLYQNTKELLFGDEFIAVYNSKQFYLVNGSSDVVCAANGSLRWAAQQPYLASICIAQKNGHFWAKTRDCLRDDKCEVGETITFECREDFQMMQINATCLSNYTWSSAPICTREDPELSSSDTYLTPVVTDNNYYENVFVYESIE
ncbi:CSMD1-like protein, partial [Mya arenaria]